MSFIEVYLDKIFIEHFIQKSGTYDYLFFINFKKFWNVLRNFRIITNFSRCEWDEELKNQNVFVKNIYTTGKNPDVEFDKDLKKIARTIREINFSTPFKIFFVDEISSDELNQIGFENITSDEFNIKWHVFFSEREDKIMQVTDNQEVPVPIKFDSWKKINSYSHPFHSLVIFDLYLLLNKENERMENNLFPLLLEMINRNPNKGSIDLQIITQFKGAGQDITETYNLIKEWLNKVFGVDRIKFSIVTYSKDVFIRNFQSLSFRRLFTNYFEISSDKGFNFFKKNDQPGKLQDVKFEFIFFGYNSDRAKTPLIEFKKYISKVENRPQIGYQLPQTNYIGNKDNRLLSFNDHLWPIQY
jgi:hypothetical protein